MTDKEMIINGVDVSECEKIGETIAGITCGNGERIRLANEIVTKHKLCKDNPNCVYKQLKRKEQECKELQEWKDANKPTGICETCTAKSLQAFDICWSALTCIDHIIKHSEQIVCLNSDEIKEIREVLNTVDTKLHKLKVV